MATAFTSTATKPMFLQAASGQTDIEYSAADMRRMLGTVFATRGVLGHSLAVTAATQPNWSVNVSAGAALLGDPVTGYTADRYLLTTATTINVPLTGFVTNPAATRTHKVWAAVVNNPASTGTYDGRIIVTEDTGAGAPDPTGTATYLLLGLFTIGTGQPYVAQNHIEQRFEPADFGITETAGFTLREGVVQYTGNNAPQSEEATPLRVTRRGRNIQLSGAVRTSVNSFVDGQGILRLAEQHRHSFGVRTLIAPGNHSPCRLTVGTDGWIGYHRYSIYGPTGSINGGGWEVYQNEQIFLDGLSWDI